MFYKKTGLPEESDVILCTVTKVQYSSVFVNIDFYNVSGMIHISEIAAGRIRNIRDYVVEGKKIVCKVLRVYPDKGHVDLSLRRVNENQRRNKVNEIKMEQKAETVITYIAKQNNMQPEKLYDDVAKHVMPEYPYLYLAFDDIVNGVLDFTTLGIDADIAKQISEHVIQRFKPKFVEINGTYTLTTYEGDGINIIKSALLEGQKVADVVIKYLGGGRYLATATATDYKEAETKLREATDNVDRILEKHKVISEFKRN